tara:strand:+ start:207 stop:827 length:621 start_codon:yes stop_codon:yes gene_type:complete
MKLKPIHTLVLSAALMLSLGACSRDSEPLPDIEATVEARVAEKGDAEATAEAKTLAAGEAPVEATNQKLEANNAGLEAKAGGLTATSKEKLLALANNRDAWFLASDITTEALEGLYGSWSVICQSGTTALSDYKRVVYEEVRPWFLGILDMKLIDAQKADRYYKVESWSSPWAYVTQTWKIGDKIILGPERQLYVLESGAWRYHDC